MAIKRYSTATIKTYSGQLHVFAEFLGSARPLHRLENRELLNGVLQIVEKRRYMFSTHKQLIGALSLYLSQVHGCIVDFSPVFPTRKPRHLPEILSLREVKAVIEKLPNLKHRAMLTMVYALGLRSGELIDLRIKDIAGDRGLVHIKKAKGNKDRILPLPDKLRLLLREYYREYRPVGYLFNGQGGASYSPQSLRKVFQAATAKAGIQKKVTLHSLRHAYATHLLEAGTDIRVIQELLGHTSIKTTMLYTHVTQANMIKVKSPLDLL